MSRNTDNSAGNNVLRIAEYFLHKANEKGKQLTNKKIQKLVYYAQVWSMVINEERLFSEDIEAWVHGPVVPSLYKHFKGFGFNPVTLTNTAEDQRNLSHEQLQLLDEVWDVYGKYDAEYLEVLTHSELPWQKARENISEVEHSDSVIDMETAKTFYTEKMERNSVKNLQNRNEKNQPHPPSLLRIIRGIIKNKEQ